MNVHHSLKPKNDKQRSPALAGLEQRLLRWLRSAEGGVVPASTLLVGFSGGPDSLALGAALARVAPRLRLSTILVHVDHRLRDGSGDDAQRCRSLAADLALPILVIRLPEHPMDAHPGVGVEEAARRERYRAYAQASIERAYAPIALAHHQGDQAETTLLHLLRGAGLRGASGMAPASLLDVPWWQGNTEPMTQLTVLRPFLAETRAEIETYLLRRGLTPLIDPTNDSPELRRNALRLDILPALERISPGATAALARYAAIAAEEDVTLDGIAGDALLGAGATVDELPVSALDDVPAAIAARMVRVWLSLARPRFVPPRDRTNAVVELARLGREGTILELGEGVVATCAGGVLLAGTGPELQDRLWSRFDGPRAPKDVSWPVPIAIDQPAEVGSLIVLLRSQPSDVEEPLLAAGFAAGRLSLRAVVEGDRFVAGGPVRDWLRRFGVPVLLRRRVLCVACESGVLLVPGTPVPPEQRAGPGEEGIGISWVETGKGKS